MLSVVGIRCEFGMAFGMGGPMQHAGWDIRSKRF